MNLTQSERRMKKVVGTFVFFFALAVGCVTIFAQGDPLPEYYGIYALQNGKLTELFAKADLNDFAPTVKFVVFAKGLELLVPIDKIFFIPQPEKPKETGDGRFKGWDDFFRQTQGNTDSQLRSISYHVPTNAVEIPFQVGPYGNNKEMVRVVPRIELPPGLYQLNAGARFWIRKAEVESYYAQNTKASSARGNLSATAKQPGIDDVSKDPVRSGSHVFTKFGVANDTLRTIQVSLDGSDTPIVIQGARRYQDKLEIGSKHLVKVIVGGKTFQLEFTVSRVMRDLHVTERGIE